MRIEEEKKKGERGSKFKKTNIDTLSIGSIKKSNSEITKQAEAMVIGKG